MAEEEEELGAEGGGVGGEPRAAVGVGVRGRRVDPEDGGLRGEPARVGFPLELVVLRVDNEGERAVEGPEPRGGGPRGYAGGEGGHRSVGTDVHQRVSKVAEGVEAVRNPANGGCT